MYDVSKVIPGLTGLIGWQQPFDPQWAILDANNLGSTSGRYFNENKWVKVEYLKETQDYAQITDEQFNDELLRLQETSIRSVLDLIFDESDYIDKQVLYQYGNDRVSTDALPGGDDFFVGYEIIPDLSKGYAFEITRCMFEFDGTGTIELKLLNTAQDEPVFTPKTISITGPFHVEDIGWVLNDSNGFYKGNYLFGYQVSSVTGGLLPWKRNYESSDILTNITGLYVDEVKVPMTNFSLRNKQGASETWGLNPDISVYEDWTNLILQNKKLFAYAIQLQGQIKALTYYLSSSRSNRSERLSKESLRLIFIELDGINEDAANRGLKAIFAGEISRIKQEVKRLKMGMFSSEDIVSVTRS